MANRVTIFNWPDDIAAINQIKADWTNPGAQPWYHRRVKRWLWWNHRPVYKEIRKLMRYGRSAAPELVKVWRTYPHYYDVRWGWPALAGSLDNLEEILQ